MRKRGTEMMFLEGISYMDEKCRILRKKSVGIAGILYYNLSMDTR